MTKLVLFSQPEGHRRPSLLSGPFGPKWGRGDWRGTSHSPTGSGPEGSSPNEVRIGSLVSLLPVFSSESRKMGDPVLRSILFLLFRKPASRDNQVRIDLFFQAEVGIRHLTVPGVQTCALPI